VRQQANRTSIRIGARVRITGYYASSADATRAPHSKAIGWSGLQVVRVIAGANYPIRVDDKDGAIGWCQLSSLEFLD
jgi:hypothetical protein